MIPLLSFQLSCIVELRRHNRTKSSYNVDETKRQIKFDIDTVMSEIEHFKWSDLQTYIWKQRTEQNLKIPKLFVLIELIKNMFC